MAVVRTISVDNGIYHGSIWKEVFTFTAADTEFECAHNIEGGRMLMVVELTTGQPLWPTFDYTVSHDGSKTLTLNEPLGFAGTLLITNME